MKIEQKQILEQDEIHETLRTRCLEVVNNEDQVITRIGEETTDSDEDVSEKKIATFFDGEGNEIAYLGTNKLDLPTFTVLSSRGDVSISSGIFGGDLSVSYVDSEVEEGKLSISRRLLGGFNIWVKNTQGKRIYLEIDVDNGKVEIESISEIESEEKEIGTSQTIFKSAE